MLKLIPDLILTLLVLFSITFICAVWGRTALRILDPGSKNSIDCSSVWIGFALVLTGIEFLHFIMPIDWRASLLFFGIAIIIKLIEQRRKWTLDKTGLDRLFLKKHSLQITLFVLIALIWCLRSMGEPNNFDSGLYHFGSIRWLNEYPIVPGLGNLHWRLALNQSYFGFLALLNIYPIFNKGYAVGGLFLIYLTAATVLETAYRMGIAWRWVYGGAFFIYLGYLAGTLPNPSPDTAIGLIEVAVFIFIYNIIKNYSENDHKSLRPVITVFILCLTLFLIKLSSIAYAATSFILMMYFQHKNNQENTTFYIKIFLTILLISSLHFLRGYLLSGAPLFPNTIGAAWGLDWAVLNDLVKFETNLIYSWGRMPGEMTPDHVLGHWGWVNNWLNTIPAYEILLFVSATILMIVNAVLIKSKKRVTSEKYLLMLYLPLIAAFGFWFFTAPDIRFLGAVPAIYISLSLYLFYFLLNRNWPQIFTATWLRSGTFGLMTGLVICFISFKLTGLRSVSIDGWMPIPVYQIEVQKTLTDLPVNVAMKSGQCWNADLPCASIFNGNLHADAFDLPWPFSFLNKNRFFYSVKFLNLSK